MSPDYVAEGFYQLVTECTNGSVMVVMNHLPYFIVPDMGYIFLIVLAIASKLISLTNGARAVRTRHYLIFFTILLLFFICIALLL